MIVLSSAILLIGRRGWRGCPCARVLVVWVVVVLMTVGMARRFILCRQVREVSTGILHRTASMLSRALHEDVHFVHVAWQTTAGCRVVVGHRVDCLRCRRFHERRRGRAIQGPVSFLEESQRSGEARRRVEVFVHYSTQIQSTVSDLAYNWTSTSTEHNIPDRSTPQPASPPPTGRSV